MKEKFLSINLKKLTMCFISAFILSAGIFAISSFYMVDNAKAQMSLLDKYNQDQANAKAAGDAWKSSDNMQSYLNLDSSQQNTASSSSQKNGGGSKIFSTISSKMWKAVGDLRKIAYVLAGFGMIAFTFGAIFNKISWKHFGNIMISLFILSIMTPLIEYIAYGEGAQNKLKFGYQYVAPGDHASLETDNSCEASGNCPQTNDDPCLKDPNSEACKNNKDACDGKTGDELEKCKLGTASSEKEGTNNAEGTSEEETPSGEGPDVNSSENGNTEQGAQKEETKAPKEPEYESLDQCNGDKKCEKEVKQRNREKEKEYNKEVKAYEKEQKAQEKAEAKAQAKAEKEAQKAEKEARKAEQEARKEQINKDYEDAMRQCAGVKACEKEAKKQKQEAQKAIRQENAAAAKQSFANVVSSTNSAIKEATQRVNDAQKAVGGAMQAVNSVTTGIHNATNSINTISTAASNMGAAFSGDGSFLDKTKAFFQGTATITNAAGNLGATAGNTIGGVTGGMSNSANAFQDLTSSSAQRDQNISIRSQGGSSNVFSGVMDDVATGSRTTGNTINQAGLGVSGAADAAGRTTQTVGDTANSAQYMLDEINRSKNTLGH